MPAPESPAVTAAVQEAVDRPETPTALVLFDAGRREDAGDRWRRELEAAQDAFLVVVALNCSWSSVLEARESLGEDFVALPVSYRGRDCTRVLAGPYGSRSQAGEALQRFPAWVAEEGARVRAVSAVLPDRSTP